MSAAQHAPGRSKLADCTAHGAGSELILVEGDSALDSVCAVRQPANQAVLAFQGKPLNAWHASPARVDEHAQYMLLAQALGLASASTPCAAADVDSLRYGQVLLLFDPDADGIHIAALLAMYFRRWQLPLLEAGRVSIVRAPMYEIVSAEGEVLHADHPLERDGLLKRLREASPQEPLARAQAHRGLGSIRPAVLRERCVDSATRRALRITPADAEAFALAFSRRG